MKALVPASLRGAPIAIFLALSGSPAMAQATEAAALKVRKDAYDLAVKCFVTYGHASGMREDAGDAAGSKAFEDKAHHWFNLAKRLAERLDYSNRQFDADLSTVQVRELPRLIQRPDYYRTSAATCRAAEQ